MDVQRPILISVVQFADALATGAMPIVDLLNVAQRLGADGVEFRPPFWRVKETERDAVRARAEQMGTRVAYATMGTLFGTDPATLREDIDDARALGSPFLRVFPGPLPADNDQAGWEAGNAIVRYARERGVTLALENYSGTPGGSLAEITRALTHLPDLATNIDIGNYTRHGEDVPAAIRTLGTRAVSAHLKDQHGPPEHVSVALGDGELPLGAILDALDALPQPLLAIFEFGGGADPEDRIARSISFLRARIAHGQATAR